MEMESLTIDRRGILCNPPEKPQALRITVNKPKLALRHSVGVPPPHQTFGGWLSVLGIVRP